MPSPFPGMDPYLEIQPRWEIFHGWFIHKLAELALPKAASMGCWIDVERDVYGEDPSGRNGNRVGIEKKGSSSCQKSPSGAANLPGKHVADAIWVLFPLPGTPGRGLG